MKDTILVVTSYPKKGTIHGEGTVGIASYTKNTLLHLLKIDPKFSFTVLSEILSQEEAYKENGMNIRRMWKRNSIPSLLGLFQEMLKPYQQIVIPFEVYMFGNTFFAGIFLLFLAVIKLLGKRITIIVHQVPEALDDVETRSLRARLFPILKHLLYSLLTFSAKKVVVFEEIFKKRLGNKRNIVVIPHAVEPVEQITQSTAKQKLGLSEKKPLVLYFGFLSPYKGVDRLIEIWDEKSPHTLILAGGGNPNHANNPEYQNYIRSLHAEAQKKNILITGFISEDKLPLYFSAADIVILPYRTFFSSSGPLSLAFAYEKPILLSPALTAYFSSEDFTEVVNDVDIHVDKIVSPMEKNELRQHIDEIVSHDKKYKEFSRELKRRRSWVTIGRKYADLLRNE